MGIDKDLFFLVENQVANVSTFFNEINKNESTVPGADDLKFKKTCIFD